MINTEVNLNQIDYETVEVEPEFLESVKTRGIAIPVHVNCNEDRYVCVDGRKRCSACAILAKEDERFLKIPVMLCNDFSKAGSSFWGNTQNKH